MKYSHNNPFKGGKCPCFPYRLSSNQVVSHVIDLNFVMTKPSFEKSPSEKIASPRKLIDLKEERVPSFLKGRIVKNNEKESC